MNKLNDSLKYELKKNPFFSTYTDAELEELFALAKPVLFKSRKEIFSQGDQGDSMYILLEGKVKISTFSSTGKETVLSFFGPGDVLGEIALLDEGPRTASAYVLEETRALHLVRKDFLPFIERHPRIAQQIISVICQRLRQTDMFIEEMVTMQAGPRLARALLRLVDTHGVAQDDGHVLIKLKLSQSNLGAHAGLMRENVNRQLKLWEEEGMLTNKNGAITIFDVEALEEVIESAATR